MAKEEKLTKEQRAFQAKLKANDVRLAQRELERAKKYKTENKKYVKAGIMDPSYSKARVKEGKAALTTLKRQSTKKGKTTKAQSALKTAENLNKFIDRPAPKKSALKRLMLGGLGSLRGGGAGYPRIR